MATYFVASGGSNTAPYDTWAKAATSLQTALTAANATGDIVVLQHDAVPATDLSGAGINYTCVAAISLIAATNNGGSSYTPTIMGETNALTRTTGNLTLSGGFKIYVYGVTFKTTGAAGYELLIGNSDGASYEMENCYLWSAATSGSASSIVIGSDLNSYLRLKNCTLRFGATGSQLRARGRIDVFGGGISSSGSAPSTLFSNFNGAIAKFTGFDLSHITGTIVGSAGVLPVDLVFDRCRFGTGYTLLATQTPANKSSAAVWVFDCAVGDVHGVHGYADAFGQVFTNTSITYTGSPAGQSWKIDTTANCSFATPFVTPPIPAYHVGTSAITPRLEILRDGSTTPFDNDEVWAEFMAKVTAGTSLATLYQDRMAIGGTPAAQAAGAGLGAWTGESGTAWSGKIDSGSALTPAEAGDISAVVCVGLPSATVYVDPFIRTD